MPRSFRSFSLLLLFHLLLAKSATGQECTSQWDYLLDTAANHPKPISGDTSAGYGIFSFYGDPEIKLVLQGDFPNARSMSIETDERKHEYRVDSVLDSQIIPDEGSQNPYLPGTPLDVHPRAFTVEVLQKDLPTHALNVLRLPANRGIQAIFYRIYAPNAGLKLDPSALPRVFAYDVKTGAPAACPAYVAIPMNFKFPEFLTIIVPPKTDFSFKTADVLWGANPGISKYCYAVDPVRKAEQVMVIRFKAPSFVNTLSGSGPFNNQGDVRYWSLCVQDFPKNETLACLPDYLSRIDAAGYANFAFGAGEDVRKAAIARGLDFIEDTRAPRQRVVGFAYRNLLPSAGFAANSMYTGEYLPRAVLCSREEFLAGDCP